MKRKAGTREYVFEAIREIVNSEPKDTEEKEEEEELSKYSFEIGDESSSQEAQDNETQTESRDLSHLAGAFISTKLSNIFSRPKHRRSMLRALRGLGPDPKVKEFYSAHPELRKILLSVASSRFFLAMCNRHQLSEPFSHMYHFDQKRALFLFVMVWDLNMQLSF